MSDIFISYSSADRERAALLAQALQARGWSVWWDRTIPPGRQFDEVIEEALDAARSVVVLWSKASIASNWVKNEASEALRRKALIPALIDEQIRIPLEFRRLQAADLSRWRGEASPEFEQFCAAIASELASAPRPESPDPRSAPAQPMPQTPRPATIPGGEAQTKARGTKPFVIAGVVVAVLAGIAAVFGDNPSTGPASMPAAAPYVPPANVAATAGSAGIHANLMWRDYVLAYSGNVSWDGTSNTAFIVASVADGYTHQSLGNRQLRASVMPNGPGRIVISTSVPVAGDSRTAGPHSHAVNLIFQAQANGTWAFVENCMSPNDCY